MRWIRHGDLTTFIDQAGAWLLSDPVGNNVPYTLAKLRLAGVTATESDGLWLHAEDEAGTVVGAAVRTPPRELLLGAVSAPAAEALADQLCRDAVVLPGVNGPVEAAEAFAARYTALSGGAAQAGQRCRMYSLATVVPPANVPGALRPATLDDLDLLTTWRLEFAADTNDALAADSALRAETAKRIAVGDLLWLWEDAGTAVSTAWLSPPTANVQRVSMVYTPRQFRGNGYASACVAAVSQFALDSGAAATMLYTDLANPTSNHIYQRIGYHPVADTTEYAFTAA